MSNPSPDIDYALTVLPTGLGREMLISRYWSGERWPGHHQLEAQFYQLAMTEWQKRRQRLIEAKIEYGIVLSKHRWDRADFIEQHDQVYQSQRKVQHLRAQLWPNALPTMIRPLMLAIVKERRMMWQQQTGQAAPGTMPTALQHALQPGPRVSQEQAIFLQGWYDCYQWLYDRASDAEMEATRFMIAIEQMGQDNHVAAGNEEMSSRSGMTLAQRLLAGVTPSPS